MTVWRRQTTIATLVGRLTGVRDVVDSPGAVESTVRRLEAANGRRPLFTHIGPKYRCKAAEAEKRPKYCMCGSTHDLSFRMSKKSGWELPSFICVRHCVSERLVDLDKSLKR